MEEPARSLTTIPDTPPDVWSETEIAAFTLGIYVFGKDFCALHRFVETKKMKDIIHYYYGKFFASPAFFKWSRGRTRKGMQGNRILSGWRQEELLKRLFSHVSEPAKSELSEAVKSYNTKTLTVEEFAAEMKAAVGLDLLVQCVGIGVPKLDLTAGQGDQTGKGSQPPTPPPEVPVGKACASLSKEATIEFLTGNCKISKARAQDLFREAVWPRLLARGWSSQKSEVQGQPRCRSNPNPIYLLPNVKKIGKGSSVKGVHYHDSVSEVLKAVADDPSLLDDPSEISKMSVVEVPEDKDEDTTASNLLLKSPPAPTSKSSSPLSKEATLELLTGNARISKTRAQDIFWDTVWPCLLAHGWSAQRPKVQGLLGCRSQFIFIPPNVEIEKGFSVKGVHYYDSVSEILKLVAEDPSLLDPPETDTLKNLKKEEDEKKEEDDEDDPDDGLQSLGGSCGQVRASTIIQPPSQEEGQVILRRSTALCPATDCARPTGGAECIGTGLEDSLNDCWNVKGVPLGKEKLECQGLELGGMAVKTVKQYGNAKRTTSILDRLVAYSPSPYCKKAAFLEQERNSFAVSHVVQGESSFSIPKEAEELESDRVGGGSSVFEEDVIAFKPNDFEYIGTTGVETASPVLRETQGGTQKLQRSPLPCHHPLGDAFSVKEAGEDFFRNYLVNYSHAVRMGGITFTVANKEVTKVLEQSLSGSGDSIEGEKASISDKACGVSLVDSSGLKPILPVNNQLFRSEVEEKEEEEEHRVNPCLLLRSLNPVQNVECMSGGNIQVIRSGNFISITGDVFKPQSRKRPAETEADQCTALGTLLTAPKKRRASGHEVSNADRLDGHTDDKSRDLFIVYANATRVLLQFDAEIEKELFQKLQDMGNFSLPLPISQRTFLNRTLQHIKFQVGFGHHLGMTRITEQGSQEEDELHASSTIAATCSKVVASNSRISLFVSKQALPVSPLADSSLQATSVSLRFGVSTAPSSCSSFQEVIDNFDTCSQPFVSEREVSCPGTVGPIITPFRDCKRAERKQARELAMAKYNSAPVATSLTDGTYLVRPYAFSQGVACVEEAFADMDDDKSTPREGHTVIAVPDDTRLLASCPPKGRGLTPSHGKPFPLQLNPLEDAVPGCHNRKRKILAGVDDSRHEKNIFWGCGDIVRKFLPSWGKKAQRSGFRRRVGCIA